MWHPFKSGFLLIALQIIIICMLAWFNVSQISSQSVVFETKQRKALNQTLHLLNQAPSQTKYMQFVEVHPEIAAISIQLDGKDFFSYSTNQTSSYQLGEQPKVQLQTADGLSVSHQYLIKNLHVDESIQRTITTSLVLVLLTALLLIVTHIYFRRRYESAMGYLASAVKELSAGKLIESNLIKGKGKISQLARALNDHIEKLHQSKNDEEELNKQMRASIVESSLDALITINLDDEIIEFSPSAERIFGWTREEVLGKTMSNIIIPEPMREGHRKGMAHFRATGEGPLIGKRVEVEALHKEGHLFPVELGLIKTEHAGTRLCTACIRDISERLQSEKDLLRAKEQAEAASKAKSRFLSYMSHEIRSPLNAVLGSLNLLKDKLDNNEQKRLAHIAQSSGENLLTVINEILDFSKIEAGHIEISQEPVSLVEMIEKQLVVADAKLKNNAIALLGWLQPELPKTIETDQVKLRQIINIFLDNALKFTKKGVVGVECKQIRDSALVDQMPALEDNNKKRIVIQVSVVDSGVGISEEMCGSIFAEFEQADAARDTGYGGTGLGLAIAKNFVEAMGGSIEVESLIGKGSQFKINVPVIIDRASNSYDRAIVKNEALVLISNNLTLHEYFKNMMIGVVSKIEAYQPNQLTQVCQTHAATKATLVIDDDSNVDASQIQIAEKYFERIVILHHPLQVKDAWVNQGWFLLEKPLINLSLREIIHGKKDADLVQKVEGQAMQFEGDILLVEDVEANRIVAGEMLTSRGFNIDYACDGLEGIEHANKKKYDVILMDVRMPKLNGIEATEHIRNEGGPNATTPIIALTANAEKSEIARCQKVGMNKFISKPFDTVNLLAHIRDCILNPKMPAPHTPETNENPLDTYPVLNHEVLLQLEKDTSLEAMPRMLTMFVDELTNRIVALVHAKSIGDVSEVREQAHAIKSCSGTFGATRLHHLGKTLENLASEDKIDMIRMNQLVDDMERLSKDTLEQFQAKREHHQDQINTD